MNLLVEHAAPYRIGGDLFRIILKNFDEKGSVLHSYEVWATYEAVQDKLGISTAPTYEDLTKFGKDFLKGRLENPNFKNEEKGAYVTNQGVYYGDPKTFPGSLEGVDLLTQTNIILPSTLHEWLKVESAKSKLSLSEIIRIGLGEYKVKSEIKEKFKHFFKCNEELRSIADSIFDHEQPLKGDKGIFISFALGKAYKTHRAALLLCELGYGEDAAQLVRSLFDLAITTVYIMADPTNGRVERYLDYDQVLMDRMFQYAKTRPNLVKELEERRINPKPGDLSIEFIKQKAEEAQKKHNYVIRLGWSDKTIREMAEEVGRSDAYRTVYNLQSNLSHSAVRSMSEYLKLDEKGITIDVSQTFNWVEESLVTAFDFFDAIIKNFNEFYQLGLEEKIDNLEKRYVGEL